MLPNYSDSRADLEALSLDNCAALAPGEIVGVGFTFAAANTPQGSSEWRWIRAEVLANDTARQLLTVRVEFSGEADVFAYGDGDDVARWTVLIADAPTGSLRAELSRLNDERADDERRNVIVTELTRRMLIATPTDELRSCRDGYARMAARASNHAAERIVAMCDEILSAR